MAENHEWFDFKETMINVALPLGVAFGLSVIF